jgi:hypothetical protein
LSLEAAFVISLIRDDFYFTDSVETPRIFRTPVAAPALSARWGLRL